MIEIELPPLEGTNPLGVLAALGTFRSAAIAMTVILLTGYLLFFGFATTIQHHAPRRQPATD